MNLCDDEEVNYKQLHGDINETWGISTYNKNSCRLANVKSKSFLEYDYMKYIVPITQTDFISRTRIAMK